jgi:hypothetical protein
MRDPSSWERLIQKSPIQPRLPSSEVLSLGIRNQHATGACIYDPQLISVIENDKTQIRSARGWRQSQRYRSGAIGIDDAGAFRCSVLNNGAIQTNRSGLLDADVAVELDYSDFGDQADRPERNNRSGGGDGIAPLKRFRSAGRYREIRAGTGTSLHGRNELKWIAA